MIEEYFPRHGVRYVAVGDSIDTMRDNNEIAPFKNILNEMYSRDISKKIHASYYLKATKGDFTGCVAPFGYRKDPENKNHLLIDEETAPIVKMIFGYAAEGRGPNYIRRRLEDKQIPCPTWWNRQRGIRDHYTKWELDDPEYGRFIWDFSAIKEMLSNPVYVGAIASQKQNYKFKLGWMGDKKASEWMVIEDQHEPIIDRETFDIVQEKVKSRQRPRQTGEFSLFSGLIKCGECGKALTIRKTNAKNPQQIYSCVTYNKFGKAHCTQHRVDYDALYQQVLDTIRECASAVLLKKDDVVDKLKETRSTQDKARIDSLTRQLVKDEERLPVLEKMVLKLYEDLISGKLNEQSFDLMIKKTQKEQEELNKRIENEKAQLAALQKEESDAEEWESVIQEYADVQELDPEMLQRLIREITVHETIDDDGTRHVVAEIHFNLKPAADQTENKQVG